MSGQRTKYTQYRTFVVQEHHTHQERITMDMNAFFTDLQNKVNQVIDNSPAKDIEKNVKAMMTQGFAKLDLVTREEFDIQAQMLAKTRAKLDLVESRLADLEAKLADK
jgi:BMFP domain-containing protein YqiC